MGSTFTTSSTVCATKVCFPPSRYTGKERDAESGNDYFGARYYSSNMGRFMSPDWSAKQDPVPYARLDNPQTLNLYAYLRNNPLAGVDADGHCPPGQDCGKVEVKAEVVAQPKIEKDTQIKNIDGKVIATGTGPTGGELRDTVSVNGQPQSGVKVTEKNDLTVTRDGKAVPGQLNEGHGTTNANGQFSDNISMQAPTDGSAKRDDAIVNNFSTHAWTQTDTQTLTLTFPSGGSCSATSTRVMTNAGPDGTPSANYTLTTTQPVVTTPQ